MSYNNYIERALCPSSGSAPSGEETGLIMSKAQTPSQIKAEMSLRKHVLLKACLEALNQIPNQPLKDGFFSSTDALAAQLSQFLQESR